MERTRSYVSGVSDAPLLGITIGEAIDRARLTWGDREALVSPSHGVRLSWRELADQVDALAAGFLALGCHGNLDVLYTEREPDDEFIRMERAVRLAQLVREYHVGCERLQMFDGPPDKRLPPLIAERRYDLLVLGSVSHWRSLGDSICPLTSRLVAATEGDVILVKGLSEEQRRAAIGGTHARRPAARSSKAAARPADQGARRGTSTAPLVADVQ